MPTYEYRCPKGHEFELFQRMSDEPTANCPTCAAASERLLSAGAGFLFKGDGFYITDYRSEAYRKAAKADTSEGLGQGNSKKEDKASSAGSSSGSDSPSDPVKSPGSDAVKTPDKSD